MQGRWVAVSYFIEKIIHYCCCFRDCGFELNSLKFLSRHHKSFANDLIDLGYAWQIGKMNQPIKQKSLLYLGRVNARFRQLLYLYILQDLYIDFGNRKVNSNASEECILFIVTVYHFLYKTGTRTNFLCDLTVAKFIMIKVQPRSLYIAGEGLPLSKLPLYLFSLS